MQVDGIFVVPAFRTMDQFAVLEVRPEHILQGAQSPFILTEALSNLASKLGAAVAIADLYSAVVQIRKQRDGKAAEGLMWQQRGLQLFLSGQTYQALELFAKAQFLLAQEENRDEFISAILFTAQAYEKAELLWAARASYVHVIDRAVFPLDFDQLLQVAEERKNTKQQVDELRGKRNEVTALVAAGTDKDQNIEKGRRIGEELKAIEASLDALEKSYKALASLVPGLPDPEVPVGETDADNVEVKRVGEPRNFEFKPQDHLELAALHKMVNLNGAREIAGSRAYALMGAGALLELAVLQFALHHVVQKGFTPVLPPLLVNEAAMFGTGYFPLGEDSAYQLEKDNLYLTGTSEVGTVAIHVNQTIDQRELPLRYVGISPCFRREAGAAGRDTKGFYRVHQFQKVEQVVFCENDPEVSRVEHNALLSNAEEIVQALELPYRIVAVCTGDMGLGQVRKHDIETWMPSRNSCGETHSCSTFYDFQARRLNIRYKDKEGKKQFVHTSNNTAIASPRILIALLENHQNKDGSVNIPNDLRPFIGGIDVLVPK